MISINFPFNIGDTVYTIQDRANDDYWIGDETPYVVGEEIVKYGVVGKNGKMFVITEEDSAVQKTIEEDFCSVFFEKAQCESFCNRINCGT